MGSANTAAIKARMTAGSVASSDYAAGMASAYAGGGLTDWFLPSKDELNAMYTYSLVGGFNSATYGGFTSVCCWSSSQASASTAWTQSLLNGSQYGGGKYGTLGVRPVRAF